MDNFEKMRRLQLKANIISQYESSAEEKVSRYLEIEHQGIIGGHYFAKASSECINLYRDGYFIGAVMMSHAINEAIIEFIAERNAINRYIEDGTTKTIEELIEECREKKIVSQDCASAQKGIWGSFRADIHHLNPTIAQIDFQSLAQQNMRRLSLIEREIFGHDIKNGAIVPHQQKYWDINIDGTTSAFLRLE